MKVTLLITLVLQVILAMSISCTPAEQAGETTEKPLSGLKIICVWTVEAESQKEVENAVQQAKDLGFNAVCWESKSEQNIPAACHEKGLKAFFLLCPLARREGAQPQVLMPGEENLTGFDRENILPGDFYQYGGEPAQGNREILDQNFTCPNDPSVVEYTLQRIAGARDAGYDGVIFDFVGYRNYHSCECALCRAKLDKFSQEHPEMGEQEARDTFYENVLVDLYDTLYVAAKKQAPEMIVGNHIHPVFLPNIFYGRRLKADFCGITVAWFFQPHWPLEKVRRYTGKVVSGPYGYPGAEGMPMTGLYTDGGNARDRKSAGRLRAEFRILKQAGASHLLMCELGHILRDKETAEIVREELAGRQEGRL
ncbi:MAG: hypothetical protein U9P14_08815 [Gemmatimonadota bacterium]|nr:hypothetical protein [Gemmatimonadota bacterium]